MKLKSKLLLVTSIALLLAASLTPTHAAVDGSPALIDYQGRVLDANGVPFASTAPVNYEIEFRIWDAQEAGTVQWSEKQVVTVDNGSFSVRLGEGTALGTDPHPTLLDLFATNKNRYLGVTVIIPNQTPGEIAPRLAFLTSPFAFVAERAKLADVATTANVASNLASNAGLQVNNPVVVSRDDSKPAPDGLVVQGAPGVGDNNFEKLLLGVNTDGNGYGSVQSFRQGTGVTSLSLNPSGGNVGIGITNPAFKLDVNGTLGVRGFQRMEGAGDIYLTPGNDFQHGLGYYGDALGKRFAGQNFEGPVLYGVAGGALGSRTGATERIAFNWNQNGDAAAWGVLSMVGAKDIYLAGGAGGYQHGLGLYGDSVGKRFAGGSWEGPVIYGVFGGALGSRQGATELVALNWTQNRDVGIGRNINIGGTAFSGGGFITTSDARLKNSIAALDRKATLKKVLALEAKSYKLNGSEETQIGFLAQDVEKLFPEFVKDIGEGKKGLNYTQMVAPLAEAIKAQQQLIESLQTQNAKLEERLKAIETKLNK